MCTVLGQLPNGPVFAFNHKNTAILLSTLQFEHMFGRPVPIYVSKQANHQFGFNSGPISR